MNALEQGEYYTQSASNARQESSVPAPAADPFADQPTYVPAALPNPYEQPPTARVPWYKTKKARIWLGFAIIVLIGIIAGVVAGVAAARQNRDAPLLQNGNDNSSSSGSSDQDQDFNSLNPPTIDDPSPIVTASPSSDTSPASGPELATLTLDDGIVPQPSPPSTSSPNQGTTIVFGVPAQPTPEQPLPTNGADSGGGTFNGDSPLTFDDIPRWCWIIPHSEECSPYFHNPPRV